MNSGLQVAARRTRNIVIAGGSGIGLIALSNHIDYKTPDNGKAKKPGHEAVAVNSLAIAGGLTLAYALFSGAITPQALKVSSAFSAAHRQPVGQIVTDVATTQKVLSPQLYGLLHANDALLGAHGLDQHSVLSLGLDALTTDRMHHDFSRLHIRQLKRYAKRLSVNGDEKKQLQTAIVNDLDRSLRRNYFPPGIATLIPYVDYAHVGRAKSHLQLLRALHVPDHKPHIEQPGTLHW